MDAVQRRWILIAVATIVVVGIIVFAVFGMQQQAPTVQGTESSNIEAPEPAGGTPSNTNPSNNPVQTQ
jgi:quinol-cytochrome oxidoreductase complex cytochrome b subunit